MTNELDTSPLVGSITSLGEDMLVKIKERHLQAGQRATGKTSASLRIIPTGAGFQLYGWKYVGSYEEGRQPGSMPPVQAIIEWGRAKGLKGIDFQNERQAKQWAWAVALRIKRMGTKRYQNASNGQPEDIFETPIREMQEQLAELVTKFYSENISRQLLLTDINTQSV